ncbi:phosphotransferase family protein [Microbacterium sp. G2-8]|uniref:phosphotransferase family protein n=1 Tax=Microbacterium sp. G2-8 TaxID=2842454 RepID=UPI001C89779A|nr:phosphotransferase family protein [Microbacterium sp. G2-8]
MTDVPGLDCAGLSQWLTRAHPTLAAGPLSASVIAGGRSNLTYRIDGAARPLVLRRPPLGHVLSSAHDVRREHRVISALAGSAVPVPPTIDVVDDTAANEVTGTPFFVMELVEGAVLSQPEQNAAFTADGLHALGRQLAEILADLHAVAPADVGLRDFGRPDGYLDRQLSTWRRQLDASRTRPLDLLDELQDRLGSTRPAGSDVVGIVHGDFRLDNVLVAGPPHRPRVASVLDWEMATLGDPLVDLGILGLYWEIRELAGDPVSQSAVVPGAGYPSFDELVDVYAARTSRAIGDLSWYRAFASYKLAVILEGIHCRFLSGDTVGEGFDLIGDLVRPLADDGIRHLSAVRS